MTTKETVQDCLEKQLQLLFEASQNPVDERHLADLTDAMVSVASILLSCQTNDAPTVAINPDGSLVTAKEFCPTCHRLLPENQRPE